MAKRTPKKPKARAKHRASWKGNLTFGLVSFGVEAFNALDRQGSDIHFHQLHAGCHRRIHYQKVCPVHGEVPNDEIVSGYEQRKGRYIEVDPDELDALRSQRERALTLDAFVSPEAVDPLYFDGRMYYLLPAGAGAQEPYAVLLEAMRREERHGIGQLVFSGKDQIVLVRPLEDVLHMAMLNYDAEIRQPEAVTMSLKKPNGLTRQIRLAQTLIRGWADDDFDFSAYEDTYREKLQALIQAKLKGQELVAPEAEDEPDVVSLMDALKKSVGETRRRAKGSSKARTRSA